MQVSNQSSQGQSKTESRVCRSCNQQFEAAPYPVRIGNNVYQLYGRECPTCEQKREREEEDTARAQQQLEIARQRREWRERDCGIPALFQVKTFEDFERKLQLKAFKLAEKFADEFPLASSPVGYRSLLLYSSHPQYGVGKTHLICAIAHRILDRWQGEPPVCPVIFTTETDILLRIRSTYNVNPYEREEDIFAKLKGSRLLILDDVGKEQPQDPKFTRRVYFHIIDGRYQRGLPMVLTSNLNPEHLDEYIGGAATDRLVEMTAGQLIQLKGESYRRRKVNFERVP